VQRAAIVLRSDTDGLELLCATDEVAARIEAVAITVGDGPGVEAIARGGPVLITDLAASGFARWPAFVEAMGYFRIGAMFAFPLQVGAIRLGVLTLYRDAGEFLSSADLKAMTLVAHAVTMVLLGSDNNGGQADGFVGMWWEQSPVARTIHQATGMVVAQLGVPVREAYLRLQGHAFANGMLRRRRRGSGRPSPASAAGRTLMTPQPERSNTYE
jgi:hypothetical protein